MKYWTAKLNLSSLAVYFCGRKVYLVFDEKKDVRFLFLGFSAQHHRIRRSPSELVFTTL